MERYDPRAIQSLENVSIKCLVQEEMIIGAPGVFGWTGAVIRVSDYVATSHSGIPSRKKRQDDSGIIDFGESFVPNMAKTPQLGPNDYFGIHNFLNL